MKTKQGLTILLLIFVAGSLTYMVVKERNAESSAGQTNDTMVIDSPRLAAEHNEPSPPKQNAQIIVYYLHGDARCLTCRKLETYAKKALDTYFADELTSGKILWQVVNVDQPQNKHFIKDYELITKSVVLSKMEDGKEVEWKNLDRIWQEVGNKQSYLEYVRDSILKFREDGKL